MKQILSILLVLALILSLFPTAFADDSFTLRDGIEFGDTLEEIEEKNQNLHAISKSKQQEYLERSSSSKDFLNLAYSSYPDRGVWYRGKILGWADTDCGFFFKDDKLNAMDYSFVFTDYTSDYAVTCYVDLVDSLKQKYGDPLDIPDGKSFILTGPAKERMNRVNYLAQWELFSCDVVDSQEWFIEKDSFYVKIDLLIYTYSGRYPYSHSPFLDIYIDLSYQKFTPAEYEAAQQKNSTASQAKNGEL